MLALLLENNINSNKQPEKDNMVSLYVDENKISEAVELLGKHGYPKNKFSTIKDVFSTDKLISTPFEDRTRYLYGLTQEIAETLSQVDGVIAVRVHVVMPQEGQSRDDKEPASAAVFVKHNPNYDFNPYIPEIKSIVSSSIAGLPYDAVNVALFPAQREDVIQNVHGLEYIPYFSIELSEQSVLRFYLIIGVCLALILLSVGVNVYFLRKG